ncbi:hypothetical protein OKA04_23415 [Luteolibacter flavescens]|uniref:Uncharacterized protein n=1 Tax=Luteolibacter flavescens TaxID=1859460 RepID=A0ABT3FWT3_9BACT|nr:hypothetical protein [Luteolibacter flavescens]MCW1887706.1 hypothetical protein [Luteolibacter flavescens]
MVIVAENPFTIPAAAERVFPHWWVRRFNVTSNSPEDGEFYAELVPYNQATGNICHAEVRVIRLPLWELVAAVPEALGAMHGVFGAMGAIVAFDDARKAPVVGEEAGGEQP